MMKKSPLANMTVHRSVLEREERLLRESVEGDGGDGDGRVMGTVSGPGPGSLSAAKLKRAGKRPKEDGELRREASLGKRGPRIGPLFPLDADREYMACLSAKQVAVVSAIANDRTHRIHFVTGRAGCGKSRIVQSLTRACTAEGLAFAVTATSAIAAESVGGSTLHSFMHMRPHDDKPVETAVNGIKKGGRAALFASLEVLVIDEVSMLSPSDLSTALDILRNVRAMERTHDIIPVLVFVGDFCQLKPPGEDKEGGEALLFSSLWARLNPRVHLVNEGFRQDKDAAFARILEEARYGDMSDASVRVLGNKIIDRATAERLQWPTLLSRNKAVDNINAKRLEGLKGDLHAFRGFVFCGSRENKDVYKPVSVDATGGPCAEEESAVVNMAQLPSISRNWDVFHAARVSSEREGSIHRAVDERTFKVFDKAIEKWEQERGMLHLKVGAKVLFNANIDAPRIVNGTVGEVVGFEATTGLPLVRLDRADGIEDIEVVQPWCMSPPLNGYSVSCPSGSLRPSNQPGARSGAKKRKGELVFAQLPLQLAWALTIHKSQGKTLTHACLDLGSSVFSDSQAYVALSRLTSLDGLHLLSFDRASIKTDRKIVLWYKVLEALSHATSEPVFANQVKRNME